MQKESSDGYVKKTTTIQFVLLGLVVGFLGGVVFSVYKLDSSTNNQSVHRHQPVAGNNRNIPSSDTSALEREVLAHPENSLAWRELGNQYFDQNEHAKAIQAYEKYLELSPGDPDVLTDLGVMYRRNGRPQIAIKKFEEAVAADPVHTQAMFNKGVVLYSDLNDLEGAVRAWQKVVSINPDAKAPNGTPVAEVIEKVRQQ